MVYFERALAISLKVSFKYAFTLGSILGAYLGTQIDNKTFDKIVATILTITALSMFFGKTDKESNSEKETSDSIKRPILSIWAFTEVHSYWDRLSYYFYTA